MDPYQVLDFGTDFRPIYGTRSPSVATKPFAAVGAGLDRVALRVMERLFLSADEPDLEGIHGRIFEGRDLYGNTTLFEDPDQYFRPPTAPTQFKTKRLSRLRDGERLRVTFPSVYETFDPEYQAEYSAFRGNEMNRIHYWKHRERGRPVAICIHTWCGGRLSLTERLFSASALYKMGLDVVMFTMPFHGSRSPKQSRFSGQLFPNRDLKRTNEAFGQAISDLRVTMKWLRETQQAGPIGMMGYSLGGYTSALMACLDESLAFVVPMIAPSSFADILWHHGEGRPQRLEAEALGVSVADMRALWGIHCPLMYEPRIARDRLLIVWGHGDRIVPTAHQLALWEHWRRPQIVSFQGGHLLHFGRHRFLRGVRTWLEERVLR
jgi:dienelactone hydrolase